MENLELVLSAVMRDVLFLAFGLTALYFMLSKVIYFFDLSLHNLTYEDAIEMALDKPLWGLLAASGATHRWCMPNNDDDDVKGLILK